MKKQKNYAGGEEGFVMIASLLILMILTLMGVAVNRNTTTEWQIAMNDRIHKDAFYNADAATELASEILEQSVACLGFDKYKDTANGLKLSGAAGYDAHIDKESLGFWRNYSPNGISFPNTDPTDFSSGNRDIVYPAVVDTSGAFNGTQTAALLHHANIKIGGNTKLTAGAAIQMAAGYEGVGKSIAMNGAVLLYDIKVTEFGERGSISRISVQYGHVLGSEGSCNY